ncbi:MAG: hypothetical protein NTW86_11595 [Candidatus Sumerlaeota bacterium]|nr:hypothetical protein [Candidatus Sumerlaeota bacterium]
MMWKFNSTLTRGGMARGTALGLAAAFALSGCSHMFYRDAPFADQRAFEQNPPRSLAVLPFANDSGVKNADAMARQSFYSAISGHHYQDIELDHVDSTLAQLAAEHRLAPGELPPPVIRQSGLADAILAGQLTAVSKFWFLYYSHIKVRIRLEMIDARTGAVLYRNEARARNAKFAPPLGITDVVTSPFTALWHLRDDEVEQTFKDFFDRVVAGIPDYPEKASHQGAYTLRDVKLRLPRNPLKVGDAIGVEFQGTPGLKAYLDLGAVAQSIPMVEMKPGRYGVRYTIPPGQSSNYCVATCRLVGPKDKVELTVFKEPFSIEGGGRIVTAVRDAQVVDGAVIVRAEPAAGTPIRSYLFYRADSLNDPFELVGRVRDPVFRDTGARPGRTYYYAAGVEGVDGAPSALSAPKSVRTPTGVSRSIPGAPATPGGVMAAQSPNAPAQGTGG